MQPFLLSLVTNKKYKIMSRKKTLGKIYIVVATALLFLFVMQIITMLFTPLPVLDKSQSASENEGYLTGYILSPLFVLIIAITLWIYGKKWTKERQPKEG